HRFFRDIINKIKLSKKTLIQSTRKNPLRKRLKCRHREKEDYIKTEEKDLSKHNSVDTLNSDFDFYMLSSIF
ncbi:hypothetical protein STEG23_022109, partial [Scotinomys teguina]